MHLNKLSSFMEESEINDLTTVNNINNDCVSSCCQLTSKCVDKSIIDIGIDQYRSLVEKPCKVKDNFIGNLETKLNIYEPNNNWDVTETTPLLESWAAAKSQPNQFLKKIDNFSTMIPLSSPLLSSLPSSTSVVSSPPLSPSSSSASLSSLISSSTSSEAAIEKYKPRKVKNVNLNFAIFLMVFIFYLCFGSCVFTYLEGENEMDLRKEFRQARQSFLKKYPSILEEDLEAFIKDVVTLNDRGITPLRNSTSDFNWNFAQALFFSTTVITTIGYGHVTPITESGKIFCLIYAIFGIPMTMVLFAVVVIRLKVYTNFMLCKMRNTIGKYVKPLQIRIIHLVLCGVIFCFIFLGIPTIILSKSEKTWSNLDAFYYCFISFTTIGLGDYIPGDELDQSNRQLYKLGIIIFLIVGLMFITLCLSVYYDIPQLNVIHWFADICNKEDGRGKGDCDDHYIKKESDKVRNGISIGNGDANCSDSDDGICINGYTSVGGSEYDIEKNYPHKYLINDKNNNYNLYRENKSRSAMVEILMTGFDVIYHHHQPKAVLEFEQLQKHQKKRKHKQQKRQLLLQHQQLQQ